MKLFFFAATILYFTSQSANASISSEKEEALGYYSRPYSKVFDIKYLQSGLEPLSQLTPLMDQPLTSYNTFSYKPKAPNCPKDVRLEPMILPWLP